MVAVFEDADPPSHIDPADDQSRFRLGLVGDLHLTVDHFEDGPGGQFETTDRWNIADPLMLPHPVVVIHPRIQTSLSLPDRVEGVPGEELFAQGLVEPFDLAGGGR